MSVDGSSMGHFVHTRLGDSFNDVLIANNFVGCLEKLAPGSLSSPPHTFIGRGCKTTIDYIFLSGLATHSLVHSGVTELGGSDYWQVCEMYLGHRHMLSIALTPAPVQDYFL